MRLLFWFVYLCFVCWFVYLCFVWDIATTLVSEDPLGGEISCLKLFLFAGEDWKFLFAVATPHGRWRPKSREEAWSVIGRHARITKCHSGGHLRVRGRTPGAQLGWG